MAGILVWREEGANSITHPLPASAGVNFLESAAVNGKGADAALEFGKFGTKIALTQPL
jgi:hypothetical protein